MTVTLYCLFTVTQFYFQASTSGPLLLSFRPTSSSIAHMVPPQLPETTLTFFSLSVQLLSTIPSLSHLDSALYQRNSRNQADCVLFTSTISNFTQAGSPCSPEILHLRVTAFLLLKTFTLLCSIPAHPYLAEILSNSN